MIGSDLRSRSLIFLILLSGLIGSCASVTPTVYNQEMIQVVDRWRIDFTYGPGRVERKTEISGDAEVRVVTEARSPRDLQLKDDIFYCLQDQHGIKLTTASGPSVGEIRIHPVHLYSVGFKSLDSAGFKSLDVVLVTPTGGTMARIRIKNGDRNATFKQDDKFAVYCADAIAKVLKGGRK